jgi:hypothetical protein
VICQLRVIDLADDVGLNKHVRFQTSDGLQNYFRNFSKNFREDEKIFPKESTQKPKQVTKV